MSFLSNTVKKISFEDIETIDVISHRTWSYSRMTGTMRSSMPSYSLTVNVKDQDHGIGTDLGDVPRAAELQEKLNKIIGLPR